mmetsp:Transcript_321/g.927  ORF Transcript_321/g.927 Transcript_321/m.927 type:complete len:284 (+) Transcript_321:1663-2514(+)
MTYHADDDSSFSTTSGRKTNISDEDIRLILRTAALKEECELERLRGENSELRLENTRLREENEALLLAAPSTASSARHASPSSTITSAATTPDTLHSLFREQLSAIENKLYASSKKIEGIEAGICKLQDSLGDVKDKACEFRLDRVHFADTLRELAQKQLGPILAELSTVKSKLDTTRPLSQHIERLERKLDRTHDSLSSTLTEALVDSLHSGAATPENTLHSSTQEQLSTIENKLHDSTTKIQGIEIGMCNLNHMLGSIKSEVCELRLFLMQNLLRRQDATS